MESLHPDPHTWDNKMVVRWLEIVFQGNCKSYIKLSFKENEIIGQDLIELTNEDLKHELQIKMLGDRKRLLREISKLKGTTNNLLNLSQTSHLY